jgi:hypothetical protein
VTGHSTDQDMPIHSPGLCLCFLYLDKVLFFTCHKQAHTRTHTHTYALKLIHPIPVVDSGCLPEQQATHLLRQHQRYGSVPREKVTSVSSYSPLQSSRHLSCLSSHRTRDLWGCGLLGTPWSCSGDPTSSSFYPTGPSLEGVISGSIWLL